MHEFTTDRSQYQLIPVLKIKVDKWLYRGELLLENELQYHKENHYDYHYRHFTKSGVGNVFKPRLQENDEATEEQHVDQFCARQVEIPGFEEIHFEEDKADGIERGCEALSAEEYP